MRTPTRGLAGRASGAFSCRAECAEDKQSPHHLQAARLARRFGFPDNVARLLAPVIYGEMRR